jgi:hypothetical protein
MKIINLKNLLFCLLLLLWIPFIYAQETVWLDPDHCTVRYNDKDWDNYGQCSGTCDMIIGQISYNYRGIIYFPLNGISINSIITNHSEIPVKCTESNPPSEQWIIKAVSIEKDPKSTSASDVFTDCSDGTVYESLSYHPSNMQQIILANKLKSKMQSNIENNKNWIAVGFYAYDPYDVYGYNYEFDADFLSVDYIVVDIYNVQESNITYNSARISWNTSQTSWTYIRYRKKGSSDYWSEIEYQTFSTNHQVDLTELSNYTEYEYKIGIRINGYDTKNKNAYKDSFQTEYHREITVTYPENDYLLLENNNYTITWTSENINNNVKIEYSSNGGSSWSNVVSSVSNSGSYNWTVPGSVGSDDCKIKITDLVHQDISE